MSHSRTPSLNSNLAGAAGEQISYKKGARIKSELSEKRRNALKEYYKLKELEAKKRSSGAGDGAKTASRQDALRDNDSDDTDNLQAPIEEIDINSQDFSDILKKTNKITTSINFINSNIKNIVYNNYYELIKLNEFLKSLNTEPLIENSGDKANLNQLDGIMDEIEQFDQQFSRPINLG